MAGRYRGWATRASREAPRSTHDFYGLPQAVGNRRTRRPWPPPGGPLLADPETVGYQDAVPRRIPAVALLVRIPAPLHQRAKLAAVRRRTSVARLVTEALTAYLHQRPTPGGTASRTIHQEFKNRG